MFSIAARFQVPICVGCTPYFVDSSASVISSRIASSATLALNSGEWFFRFFILDCHVRHAIHLNPWPEFARPPLPLGVPSVTIIFVPALIARNIAQKISRFFWDNFLGDLMEVRNHKVVEKVTAGGGRWRQVEAATHWSSRSAPRLQIPASPQCDFKVLWAVAHSFGWVA
jgi:hypothetical protein